MDGKRFEKKITYTDTGIVVNYPNQVEIFYDKNNPSKSFADVELGQNKQKANRILYVNCHSDYCNHINI